MVTVMELDNKKFPVFFDRLKIEVCSTVTTNLSEIFFKFIDL